MKPHPLTLAALATSAVPGLNVFGYGSHSQSADYEGTAVLESSMGSLLVKIPLDPTAEVRESAEILSLTALSEGARRLLPFDVPYVLGITGFNDTRVVVTTLLPGIPLQNLEVTQPDLVLSSLIGAIAAIHSMPLRLLLDEGLPGFSVAEIRQEASKTLQRALRTGLVPEVINDRWRGVLSDDALWDFQPTPVHANLDEQKLLFQGTVLTGIIGWSGLRIADPAMDLAWVIGDPHQDQIFQYYLDSRRAADSVALQKRANFWHEFQIVKWLLHGIDTRNNGVVKDAITLFDELIDYLNAKANPRSAETNNADLGSQESAQQTGQDPAEILAKTPDDVSLYSETAEFEALDEDREFLLEDDFTDFDPK